MLRDAERLSGIGWIWLWAILYFASYVPYLFFLRVIMVGCSKSGFNTTMGRFEILPIYSIAAMITIVAFVLGSRWWTHIPERSVGGLRVRLPGKYQAMSGLCVAAIALTTTLAYTFGMFSVVIIAILMRAGVLMTAPVVDYFGGRKKQWYSWAGLLLCVAAVIVLALRLGRSGATPLTQDVSQPLPWLILIILAYVAAYFARFHFMTRLAKTRDPNSTKSYFAQEQMVAMPALVVALAIFGLIGRGEILIEIRRGFAAVYHYGTLPIFTLILIGILSTCTGIFGALIYLHPRENTYCVPVNRSSSVLASILGAIILHVLCNHKFSSWPLAGAILVLGAVAFLGIPPLLGRGSR